jgi:hypothetical protein
MEKAMYKMKFTAEDAKKFKVRTAEEEIDAIEPLIATAAKEKQLEVRLLSDFWINEGYSQTEKYIKACKILRDNGYTVEFFYEERQFVNMYTVVKW